MSKARSLARYMFVKPRTLLLVIFALFMVVTPFISLVQVNAASSNTALKWSTQPAAGNGIWASIVWSPELGKFVAVGRGSAFPVATNKRTMTSTDGKSWTLVSSSNISTTAAAFTSVTWSPELSMFVAVACARGPFGTCSNSATSLRVMTSPDGEVWTERTAADTTSTWQSIVWSPDLDLFVAVADSGDNSVMTSSNGTNWTQQTVPEDNAWKSVTWSPELDLFVAIAGSGTNRVMTSPDGINWTARTAAEANTWVSVTWSPELSKFVAVASDGTNRVMTSTNGTNWTAHAASSANIWSSVTWSPELQRFVAVANGGTDRVMTSADGETWTAQAASVDNAWNAVTWSPGISAFVAVGSGGTFDNGTITSPRAMTGSMITASTNAASNITASEATLSGEYLDDFSNTNTFFTGTSVFFRYRVAGSSNPFLETTPQAVASQGVFSANVTGLNPYATYEFKAVVQWPGANGTQTLEGGLETFTTEHMDDDDDNDGIFNDIEDLGPNNGDANGDGTPDSTQPYVASFISSVTGEYVLLQLDDVCQIDDAAIKPESENAAVDQAYGYPMGLMDFTADCGTPGFMAVVIQVYFGVDHDNYVVRKFDTNNNSYSNINDAVIDQSADDVIVLGYAVVDGGDYDMNPADGVITDPAGLAVVTPTPAGQNPESQLSDTGESMSAALLGGITVSLVSMGMLLTRTQKSLTIKRKLSGK